MEEYKYCLKFGNKYFKGKGKKKRKVVYCPTHPNAHKNGSVYYHRLVKEVEIGRYLKDGEIVHHRDGDKDNDDPKNLKVEKHGDHTRKHMLDIGQKWFGFNCPICDHYFEKRIRDQNNSWAKGKQGPFCCRSCAYEASKLIYKGECFGKTKIVRRFKKKKKARYGLVR